VVSEDSVAEIELQYFDSLKNGALWGGLVGAGLGALAMAGASEGTDVPPAAVAAVYLGFGVGIGIGIDALTKGWKPVYTHAGSDDGASVSFYPIVTRYCRGVGIKVRF
jgi:hypothetical protein